MSTKIEIDLCQADGHTIGKILTFHTSKGKQEALWALPTVFLYSIRL